jgi:hypothetical protein
MEVIAILKVTLGLVTGLKAGVDILHERGGNIAALLVIVNPVLLGQHENHRKFFSAVNFVDLLVCMHFLLSHLLEASRTQFEFYSRDCIV